MGRDIFTEPDDVDLDALANLGPLTPLAGTWEGKGLDTHPVAEGSLVLQVAGRSEPFHHVDKNLLRRVAGPQPNPAWLAANVARSG
jgi:hypothetical protein